MVKFGEAVGWQKSGSGGGGVAKCQNCGKPVKDPKFKFCWECDQKMKKEGAGDFQTISLPKECIFETFYDSKTHLRREIFIESADKASEIFMNANISQTSLRNLFHLLKDMANRLQADKRLDFGVAVETFFKFHRQVVYNVNRKGDRGPLLHPVFKEFVESHTDVATKSREEYLGFVEYLTSIVARLKSK
jgi:CRISPR/Cas system CSM-associated protein Csm2 small subunit